MTIRSDEDVKRRVMMLEYYLRSNGLLDFSTKVPILKLAKSPLLDKWILQEAQKWCNKDRNVTSTNMTYDTYKALLSFEMKVEKYKELKEKFVQYAKNENDKKMTALLENLEKQSKNPLWILVNMNLPEHLIYKELVNRRISRD